MQPPRPRRIPANPDEVLASRFDQLRENLGTGAANVRPPAAPPAPGGPASSPWDNPAPASNVIPFLPEGVTPTGTPGPAPIKPMPAPYGVKQGPDIPGPAPIKPMSAPTPYGVRPVGDERIPLMEPPKPLPTPYGVAGGGGAGGGPGGPTGPGGPAGGAGAGGGGSPASSVGASPVADYWTRFEKAIKPLLDVTKQILVKIPTDTGAPGAGGGMPAPPQPAGAPAAAAPQSIFATLTAGVSQTASGFLDLTKNLAEMHVALAGLFPEWSALKVAIGETASNFMTSFGKGISKTVKGIKGSKAYKATAAYVRPIAATAKGVAGGVKAVAGGAAKIGGAVKAGAGAAMGAVSAVGDAFMGAVGQIRGFVAALNPASILAFDQVMKDLQATIGVALQPAFDVATAVLRDFANAMLPVMQQLRPIITQVAESFMQVATTVITVFASTLKALMPVIQVFADLMKGLAPVLQAAAAIFSGLVEVISTALGSIFGDVSGTMKSLQDTMLSFAKAMIMATAHVIKFFSVTAGNAFVEGVIKALKPPPESRADTTGLAAGVSPQVSGIAEWSRAVATSAMMAGPGAAVAEKTQAELFGDVVAKLEAMKGDNTSGWDKMINALRGMFDKLGKDIYGAIPHPLDKSGSLLYDFMNPKYDWDKPYKPTG